MSASFSLAGADVDITDPNAEPDTPPVHRTAVQVMVRNGRARLLTQAGAVVVEKDGVVLSVRNSRNSWSVTFTDGESWKVARTSVGCKKCG